MTSVASKGYEVALENWVIVAACCTRPASHHVQFRAVATLFATGGTPWRRHQRNARTSIASYNTSALLLQSD